MESQAVIAVDPDYARDVVPTAVLIQEPTEHQVLFAQHLLAMLRRLPRNYLLPYRVGKLLDLLEKLPGAGINRHSERRPAAAHPLSRALTESPAVSPAERPIFPRERGPRLPHGEPLRRIKLFLESQAIAAGCSLSPNTVLNIVHRGELERDGIDPRLFRLRTVQPIPLSAPTDE